MGQIKLALRTLTKTPFVSTIAVLSIALGIGANAAIFSLFDQILLKPLPVERPEELVNFAAPGPKQGSTSCNQAGDCDEILSYPMFRDLAAQQSTFTHLAAHRLFGANVSFRNQVRNAEGVMVSGSYFPALGIQPAVGRLLAQADDETVGEHPVAVLGHDYWTTHLGSDTGVLGESVVVNGSPFTIVGIAPSGFRGTTLGANPAIYVPLTMRGVVHAGWDGFENRRNYWAYVFGRLAPGASIEQAATNLNGLYRSILVDVEAPLQTMSEQTLSRFKEKELLLRDGIKGQSSIHGEAEIPLLILLSITAMVLIIACANIANLLLVRGAGRSQEMAIRGALGAGRWKMLTQLLTESLLLATLGGLASLLVAGWTLQFIGAMLPPDASDTIALTLSGKVITFTAILALGTGVLFGLYPALQSTRTDINSILRATTGQTSVAKAAARFRSILVTAQIALSMALLVGSGLFIKSLVNVSRVDLGLNSDQTITFAISPELNGYAVEDSKALFQRAELELAAIPGVERVTSSLVPLLAGSNWGTDVSVEGWESGPDIDSNSRYNEVGAGYFSTLGMELLAGREFTIADGEGAPTVALVNEAFARKFNLDGRNAVGKFMSTTSNTDSLTIQIVGLIRDAKYSDVKQEVPPLFFLPWVQQEEAGSLHFYVKTSLDPTQVMQPIRAVINRLDPNLPLQELKTLDQQVRENVFMDRMITTLAGAFALLATVLAATGLYGILAYTVAQRTREIGLRMALGADAEKVRGMVLKQMTLMLAVGGFIGVVGALALGQAAESLLYGMTGMDPVVVVSGVMFLSLIAMAAAFIPARRASLVDPMVALRYE